MKIECFFLLIPGLESFSMLYPCEMDGMNACYQEYLEVANIFQALGPFFLFLLFFFF